MTQKELGPLCECPRVCGMRVPITLHEWAQLQSKTVGVAHPSHTDEELEGKVLKRTDQYVLYEGDFAFDLNTEEERD